MAGPTADRIVTPEAVVLDFETAGLASRLLSGAIDIAVQFLLLLVVIIGGVAVAEGFGGGGVAAAAVYFAIFLTLFGYPAAQETLWRGKTVGKAAMGLRVVTADGLPVRFRHAAIRSMLGLVDKFLASGAIGLIAILVSGRNQRLGDLVAGTIVLRERKASQAPVALAFPPPPGLEDYCASLDVAGLSQRDYVAIRSFLLRARSLPPQVRFGLARDLASPLRDRLRSSVPAGMHPEVWLACLLAAQQARTAGQPFRSYGSVWDLAQPAVGSAAPIEPAAHAGGFSAPG